MGLNLQIPAAVQTSNKGKGKTDNGQDKEGKKATDDVQENRNSPLSPNTRWNDALSTGGMQRMNSQQMENKNDPKSRWQRTGFYAERITGYDGRGKKSEQEDGTDQSAGAKAAALAPNKQM